MNAQIQLTVGSQRKTVSSYENAVLQAREYLLAQTGQAKIRILPSVNGRIKHMEFGAWQKIMPFTKTGDLHVLLTVVAAEEPKAQVSASKGKRSDSRGFKIVGKFSPGYYEYPLPTGEVYTVSKHGPTWRVRLDSQVLYDTATWADADRTVKEAAFTKLSEKGIKAYFQA